jgi:hypothetical protein
MSQVDKAQYTSEAQAPRRGRFPYRLSRAGLEDSREDAGDTDTNN